MRTYEDDPAEDGADDNDEYTTHNEPRQKSFYEQHGFDERDGPPEEEEEHGYRNDPGELNHQTR